MNILHTHRAPTNAIRMGLFPWMRNVFYHPARHKRVSGGRGILKTEFAFKWVTVKVLDHPMPGAEGTYSAPTQAQCKRIVWDRWNTWLESQPRKVKVGENANDLTIRLIDGKKLVLVGMDKYENSRGLHPVAGANDEAARSRQQGFIEVLNPAFLNHKAETLDITSPKGKNWWYGEFLRGFGPNPEHGHKSWKIPSWLAGMHDPRDLEAEFRKLPLAIYQQEYEGEFTGATGPLFPEYSDRLWPDGHLIPPAIAEEEIRKGGYPLGAIDWGRVANTAVLWGWVTTNGGIIVTEEFVQNNRTPAQILQAANNRRKIPPSVILDSSAWGAEWDGGNIADLFGNAARALKLGSSFAKADKRFDPSIQKFRDMMTMPESKGELPKFSIVYGKAPRLRAQIMEASDEHVKPGGGGFRDSFEADCLDGSRYLLMGARPGSRAPAPPRHRGPLPGRIVYNEGHGLDDYSHVAEEPRRWHPLTGAPEWD